MALFTGKEYEYSHAQDLAYVLRKAYRNASTAVELLHKETSLEMTVEEWVEVKGNLDSLIDIVNDAYVEYKKLQQELKERAGENENDNDA